MGLLRLFWTLLFREIKNSLFDVSDNCYVPRHDVIALQVRLQYVTVSEKTRHIANSMIF